MNGGFQVGPFQINYQQVGAVAVAVRSAVVPDGGTKARPRVRGPYSDPRIFQAYIERCIAERNAPRQNVEVATLKEALIDEVELRRTADLAERDLLLREAQILRRLLAIETARRDIAALTARQNQIARQIQQMEDDEASALLALFDEM